MKKFNLAGTVLFVVLWISTISRERYGEPVDFSMLAVSVVVILFALLIAGLDRWIGNHKFGAFPVSLVWSGYWAITALVFFQISALYGFAVGFGSSGAQEHLSDEFYMYGYIVVSALYSTLAIVNLIKFFIKLFTLPKVA